MDEEAKAAREREFREAERARELRGMLWEAIGEDDAKRCARALALGADPEEGPLGVTGLMLAASEGSVSCLKLLLGVSDASLRERMQGNTALMLASQEGHADCVKLLADPQRALEANKVGETALMLAASGGRTECVKALLALPNAREQALAVDGEGASALARAFMHEPCALLLAPWSDLEARIHDRWTVLEYIESSGGQSIVQKIRLAQAEALGREIEAVCAQGPKACAARI